MKFVNQADQVTQPQELTQPYNHSLRLWSMVGILIAAFIFSYYDAISALIKVWFSRDDYSHGFLIPFIAIYFVWVEREKLKTIPIKPHIWGGLILILVANLMFLLGSLGGIVVLQETAILIIIFGFVLMFLGVNYIISLIFPLSYLIFMIPSAIDVVVDRIHWPFQLFSATSSAVLINLLNIPVFHEAQFLNFPNITLEVAKECSGVKYLISIIALAVPLSYFTQKYLWRRLSIVLVAISIGILANVVRVTLIGIWTYNGGEVHGPSHVLQGLFVSVVGYIFLFIGVWFLKMPAVIKFNVNHEGNGKKGEQNIIDNIYSNSLKLKQFNKAWIVTLFLLLIVVGHVYLYKTKPVSLKSPIEGLPVLVGSWSGNISNTQKDVFPFRVKGADHEIIRNYSKSSENEVLLYVAYFETQKQDKELIHDNLYRLYNESKEMQVFINNLHESVSVNRALINKNKSEWLVYYWYDIHGHVVANRYKAKCITAFDGLFYGKTNGAIVMVVKKLQSYDEFEHHFDEEKEFISKIIPILGNYIP